jgi:transcriptional regulator with XRE-family HTH domain
VRLEVELDSPRNELAVRAGVVFTTLSKWERGKANLLLLALQRIEAVLHDRGDRGQDLLEKYFPKQS